MEYSQMKVPVVIPNWNGKDSLRDCLNSLKAQTVKPNIIVVENGSTDGSLEFLRANYPDVDLVINQKNLGFAGGVNSGIKKALEQNAEYIALFNNDAIADRAWLENLCNTLAKNPEAGIATGKLLDSTGKRVDSTGDFYTTWGLPFPRGRGEKDKGQYDPPSTVQGSTLYNSAVFGATGGASLYRAKMLAEVGLFDEDFFAYYEDVDLSFRAQLAGWKVLYTPTAKAYHQQGATSGKIKGFSTYQTFKNYPLLFWKNVPLRLLLAMLPRFLLAYCSIAISSTAKGNGWYVLKGILSSLVLLPKKLGERWQIQRRRTVGIDYIRSILVDDLPPNAHKLRKLRGILRGKIKH